MAHIRKQAGYTLMELMIAVGIIGVLTAIAIPTYNNYINTSCLSTARTNLETLASFEENYNIENGSYLGGVHKDTDNLASSQLMGPLHWDPNDKKEFEYTVIVGGSTTDGTPYEYVITVAAKKACLSATAAFGITEQGFHETTP